MFINANYACCIDNRTSISDYFFFLDSSLISQRADKYHTVSRSSSKAEYMTLSFASSELQWLITLLEVLRVNCTKLPTLYCDNQSAKHIATNLVFHERTKHLKIDCHFVRERIQKVVFKLLPIPTKTQLTYIFTKPLSPKTYQYFISKL